MKLKRFTQYLLEHRLRAMLLVFGFSFIPVVGMLGILYAGLVTLRKGAMEGAVMTAAVIAPYVLVFMLSVRDPNAQLFVMCATTGVVILTNVATWVFAVMLYRQMTWSGIIQVAALAGVLVISVIHLAYPDITDWWTAQLSSALTALSSSANTAGNDIFSSLITRFSKLLFALSAWYMLIASILLNAVMQLILARWWQSAVFSPGMLRRELHNIRLSSMAGVLFMLSVIFVILGNNVVIYMMPILCMLFAGAGLSVIHYFFGLMNSSQSWFWICFMYVSLYLFGPISMVLLAIIALLDIWLDLRRKLRKI
jgi:hypothetical protein